MTLSLVIHHGQVTHSRVVPVFSLVFLSSVSYFHALTDMTANNRVYQMLVYPEVCHHAALCGKELQIEKPSVSQWDRADIVTYLGFIAPCM